MGIEFDSSSRPNDCLFQTENNQEDEAWEVSLARLEYIRTLGTYSHVNDSPLICDNIECKITENTLLLIT